MKKKEKAQEKLNEIWEKEKYRVDEDFMFNYSKTNNSILFEYDEFDNDYLYYIIIEEDLIK